MAAASCSVDSGGLPELGIVLLGGSNTGKSSAGNTILGKEVFTTEKLIKKCVKRQGEVCGRQVTVVDTPGCIFYNLQTIPVWLQRETLKSVTLCPPGRLVFLLTVPVSLTLNRKAVKNYMEMFEETIWTQTIVLFTCADRLENNTLEQHLETEGKALKWLVEKCGNRYHALDNTDKTNHSQVTELLKKIDMTANYRIKYCSTDSHLQRENMKVEDIKAKTRVKETGEASIWKLKEKNESEYLLYMFHSLENAMSKLKQTSPEKERLEEQRLKDIPQRRERERARCVTKESIRGKSQEVVPKGKMEYRNESAWRKLLSQTFGKMAGGASERGVHGHSARERKFTGGTKEHTLPVRRRNSKDLTQPNFLSASTVSQSFLSVPTSSDSPAACEWTLVLLGCSGAGKSAAGNTILGKEEFVSRASSTAVTRESSRRREVVAGRQVSVVDTPDWARPELSLEAASWDMRRCARLSSPGPHAFLLVTPVDRSTGEERDLLNMIQTVFGEGAVEHTMVLFTHGDRLKDGTIEEFVEAGSKDLKWLIQTCGNRYHVLNNNSLGDRDQVTELLDKVEEMVAGHKGSHYHSATYRAADSITRRLQQQLQKEEKDQEKEGTVEGWQENEGANTEKMKREIEEQGGNISNTGPSQMEEDQCSLQESMDSEEGAMSVEQLCFMMEHLKVLIERKISESS